MSDYSIYKQDCLKFLQRLIKTPSVNGRDNEEQVVKVIESEARKLNLPYKMFQKQKKRPNIFVGHNFTSNKNLLLVAHTDTVSEGVISSWQYPPFSGQIKNGKIYGRGVLDCKGGIAISLYVLKILKDKGKLKLAKFVGVADEEGGADSEIGLKFVLKQGLSANGAVYTYGEKQDKDSLIIGQRGLVRVWIVCHGQAAHSGSLEWQKREKGENSIEGIFKLLTKLEELDFPERNKYFPGYKFILTPTIIKGGNGESVVPEKTRVLLDIRTLPEHSNKIIINKISQKARQLTTKSLRFEIKIKNNLPAALTNPNEQIVQTALKLSSKIYNTKLAIKGAGSANEAYLLIRKRIPTIIGGGPLGGGFHSANEYAEIDSIEKSLQFLTELALQLDKKH